MTRTDKVWVTLWLAAVVALLVLGATGCGEAPTLDLSKRLCDATLAEYLAAERTVGILTGWAVALFTAVLVVAGRWGYKKWATRKAAAVKPGTEQWPS